MDIDIRQTRGGMERATGKPRLYLCSKTSISTCGKGAQQNVIIILVYPIPVFLQQVVKRNNAAREVRKSKGNKYKGTQPGYKTAGLRKSNDGDAAARHRHMKEENTLSRARDRTSGIKP